MSESQQEFRCHSVPDLRELESLRATIESTLRRTSKSMNRFNRAMHEIDMVYQERDLDLMRIYGTYFGDGSKKHAILTSVTLIRLAHGQEAAGIITGEHISSCSRLWTALIYLNSRIDGLLSADDRYRVISVAFENLNDVELILHLINDRDMWEEDDLRDVVARIRKDSPSTAVAEGVL